MSWLRRLVIGVGTLRVVDYFRENLRVMYYFDFIRDVRVRFC